VRAHLAAGCETCTGDSYWYATVSEIAATDDSLAPPAWVLKRAFRTIETQRLARPAGRIARTVATLVFDSLTRPSPAGVRSAESSNRQLLYRAGPFSVDVQVLASAHTGVDLIGQVLREGEAAFESVAQVELEMLRMGRTVMTAYTNDRGEFAASNLEPGILGLRVHLVDSVITIHDLPLTLT
jgi:hypothetical protein